MSRPTGAKDTTPREMSAASLANMTQPLPAGLDAKVFRVTAIPEMLTEFGNLTARERGKLITEALAK